MTWKKTEKKKNTIFSLSNIPTSDKKKLVIDLDFWLDMISSKRAKLNFEGDLVEDFSPESRPISDRQKCT